MLQRNSRRQRDGASKPELSRTNMMNDQGGPQRPQSPKPTQNGPDGSPSSPRGGANWLLRFFVVALIGFLLFQFYNIYNNSNTTTQTAVKYGDFITLITNNQVKDVVIQSGTITGDFKTEVTYPAGSNTKITSFKTYEPDGNDPSLVPLLQAHGVSFDAQPADQGN